MVKALEVSIDGIIVGTFVPARGNCFSAILGNIPRKYMRVQICSGSDTENWHWQLPDISEGQVISFKMVDAPENSGIPPGRVLPRDPEKNEELKRLARQSHKQAKRERKLK